MPDIAQPTAEPTAQPTSTEFPLISLPLTGACVAAANGNFRVNLRDWPGEDGEIVDVLSAGEVVPAMAHVKVFDGRDSSLWLATSGGFVFEGALRFGGENCDTLPEIMLEGSGENIVLSADIDDDNQPDILNNFGSADHGATEDDICIEYPYRDPYGSSGTICLPFDISSPTVYCENGHCIIVEPYMEEHEDGVETLTLAPTPLPEEDSTPWIIASNLHINDDGSTSDDDVCIEYDYSDASSPKGGGKICLPYDINELTAYCIPLGEKNCAHWVIIIPLMQKPDITPGTLSAVLPDGNACETLTACVVMDFRAPQQPDAPRPANIATFCRETADQTCAVMIFD